MTETVLDIKSAEQKLTSLCKQPINHEKHARCCWVWYL